MISREFLPGIFKISGPLWGKCWKISSKNLQLGKYWISFLVFVIRFWFWFIIIIFHRIVLFSYLFSTWILDMILSIEPLHFLYLKNNWIMFQIPIKKFKQRNIYKNCDVTSWKVQEAAMSSTSRKTSLVVFLVTLVLIFSHENGVVGLENHVKR